MRLFSIMVALLLGASTVQAQQDFIGCGRLIQGVSCVLFETPSGQQYLLDNVGPFQVGDDVLVIGTLDGCFSICLQGDGCIMQNTIEPCPPFSGCGELVDGGLGCLILDADDGNDYELIGDPLGFQPGDIVSIDGIVDEFCTISCGGVATNGCLLFDSIGPCVIADPVYLRGDANNSGDVSALPDGLFVLNFGFNGGATPACMDAADADGSGDLSGLLDGLAILNWGFLGGAPPPPPFPDCDLGAEVLGCLDTGCI